MNNTSNNTLINVVLEWTRAPAALRLEFDHAKVTASGINVGWGTRDKSTDSFTFSSTDEMCRICIGLVAEGSEKTGINAVLRVVDTEKPFDVAISDILKQESGELILSEPKVKMYAEINWFEML
jgi:hypothetical protein